MCKSSRDSKDYFFLFFFCPSPFHSVNSVLLILAAFFFSPQICCPKILDVLDLKLSDSWHFFFIIIFQIKDTKMHSDAATSSSFSLNLDGLSQSVQ